MFILSTIDDLVEIKPEEFNKPSQQIIENFLNEKYCNKVIQKIGLCIGIFDILEASDGRIGHGTGIVNVNVLFRLIVFRPFQGEILQGKIASASPTGIRIQLGFFDDIFVPPSLMFPPSEFNTHEQTWVWMSEGNEYFYDKGEPVRFRVESETWNDLSPAAPSLRMAEAPEERKSPYSITASMTQSGLGPAVWW